MHFSIPTVATILSLSALISAETYSITWYNEPHRGGSNSMTHENREYGKCYNLKRDDFNNKIGSAFWPDDKQCIFWEDWKCKGYHTESRQNMVDSGTWKGTISSYTCCPDGKWCAGYSQREC